MAAFFQVFNFFRCIQINIDQTIDRFVVFGKSGNTFFEIFNANFVDCFQIVFAEQFGGVLNM